jgi:hypothetical protein
VRAEPAGAPGAVRVSLDGGHEAHAAIDWWAVDWEHDGRVFRSGWHAGRDRKRALALAAEHAYAAAGTHRIAVKIAGVDGGERRTELTWVVG